MVPTNSTPVPTCCSFGISTLLWYGRSTRGIEPRYANVLRYEGDPGRVPTTRIPHREAANRTMPSPFAPSRSCKSSRSQTASVPDLPLRNTGRFVLG